ncbi:MAG: branched chain amino acid aminotransferase [Saccharothrix sp.]|nr:branched chain amino acid aminotransferase [Saccharothrix sp.]
MTGTGPVELAWWQGKLVPSDTALSMANHSLNYGVCVIEGITAMPADGAAHHVFRLDAHVARFVESCRLVGITLEPTATEIAEACHEVLVANGMRRAYLRPIAFLGDGVLGLAEPDAVAEVAVLAFDASGFDGRVRGHRPRLTLSPVARLSPTAFPTKAKVSGGYVNSRMALVEARRRGFDEAVLLDDDGFVAECSVQNVFGVRGRTVLVPESAAALDGITVASAAELAAALGYEVVRGPLAPAELAACDAVCVTGTAAGVRPAVCLDDVVLDPDNAVVADLVRAYGEAERGVLTGFEHWSSTR